MTEETHGEQLDRMLKRQLEEINKRLIEKGQKPIKWRYPRPPKPEPKK